MVDWIRIGANLNRSRINQLDSLIKYPVSRSQVLDAILEYCLKSPEFLQAIINNEQDKINARIENSI